MRRIVPNNFDFSIIDYLRDAFKNTKFQADVSKIAKMILNKKSE